MTRLFDHVYIFSTIAFTLYSQMIIRWQVSNAGNLPADFTGKMHFVGSLLVNPWIISGILATFFAGVSWILTMSRFEISYAYPWISLNFIFVLILGGFLLDESFTSTKLIGTLLIIMGVIVISRN